MLLGLTACQLLARPATAQQLVRRFAGSTVLLTSGDTVRGPLTLYSQPELLVVRTAGGVRTLAPPAVRAFAVKGELTNHGAGGARLPAPLGAVPQPASLIERTLTALVDTTQVRLFLSYRVPPRPGADPDCAPGFYEVLCEGAISLLRRESAGTKHVPRPTPPDRADSTRRAFRHEGLSSTYFIFTPWGQLRRLRYPRQELAQLLAARHGQLSQYIAAHRLDYRRPQDLTAIVGYANSLLTAE
ncbi:hypothetical protein [Hymenobacter edaphi]|uniref:hypothetical protein n=1 Tax=Hymenobacter edaphi TaxID=2211146 RepID=UPI001402D3A0|nr:hypothetical protein [Hymenobacter edaphi]